MISAYNAVIDAVTGAKTQFVKTFVPNAEIAKPLQTYIDAQSSFAKTIGQETLNFVTTTNYAIFNFDAKKAFATK